jgi:outer membrane protein TolC
VRTAAAILIALLCPQLAGASELSLSDAVRAAVARNPRLASTAADVAIAGDRVTSALGGEDWILTGDARWDTTRAVPAWGVKTYQDRAADGFTMSTTITRPLTGGGTIGLRADAGFSRRIVSLELGPKTRSETLLESFSSDVLVVFRQPLLRGWNGDLAPRTKLARTRAAEGIARLDEEATAATLVRDVARAYWEVVYAREDLAIRRASLTLALEQRRVTQARIDAGKAAASEALAVGETIAVRRDEIAQAEEELAARSLELRRLSGLEIDARAIAIDPADRPGGAMIDPDVDRELAFAVERNPDVRAAEARGEAAALEVEVTENGLLPSLDLAITAGPRGIAPDARRALAQENDLDGGAFTAELVLTIPIGDRAAHGAHDAAKHTLRRARLDAADLRRQVEAAVVAAAVTMRAARERSSALEEAVYLSEQAIDAEHARWEDGKSTNYDVMKRQEELAESRLRLARAQTDYREAEAALDALTGAILPRYGVAVLP